MSVEYPWMVLLLITMAMTAVVAVGRRRRHVRKRAREARRGRAGNAVRAAASQRDDARAARRQAEAFLAAARQEHRSLREACLDLARRWAMLPPGEPHRNDPCAFAEELRHIVHLHGEGSR